MIGIFTFKKKSVTILLWLTVFFCLCLPGSVFSADYFVALNGNNSWQGNVENGGFLPQGCDADGDTSDCTNGPWRTIQYALDNTGSGDVITVKKGTYAEYIYFHNSGSSTAQRVLQGETDSVGDRLTTIDPGVAVTGWVSAPEVGSGVYKVQESQFGYTPAEMTVQGKRIGVIHSRIMESGEGFKILAKSAGEQITLETTGITINYWDGIEALAGSKNGVFYIRFRNGEDPNLKSIKAYRNNYVLGVYGQNYNTIKSFNIVCANVGVTFENSAHDNIVEDCRLINGRYRLGFFYGAYDNIIRNNFMSMNLYGYNDLGPWIQGKEKKHGIREHVYQIFKYKIGSSTSDDTALQMIYAGNGNEIYDNTIQQGLLGITLTGKTGNITNGTKIHDNLISGINSVGVTCSPGVTETFIYNNKMINCAISFRIHKMNDPDTDAATFYIYHNKSWLPRDVGRHIFVYWLSSGNDTKANTFWICNNSFSGGYYGLYNARHSENQLLPKVYLLNNIFSSKVVFYSQSGSTFYQKNGALGGYDYNWLSMGGQCSDAVWCGTHNIIKTDYFWPENDASFDVKNQPAVKDKGIVLSNGFTVGGVAYPALKQMVDFKYEGTAPELGAVELPAGTISAPKVLRLVE